ncbi:hypothetical protein FA09DRAFT_34003 [Tilletiopsis washingtonensis]|uniref:Uncharacterized protein n=1 Tax=Tilletiopsis washingtonensis TaxID=58919 RepID=A0A316Z9J2_9BASI|nr:hypothetical protein FA09DRAFT_34003 [Tilletiopsis washingtonensis]PWN97956.1 hypothetical protein FA09DRAFT_34003 [Tilletiopsis washingtonensis]
MPAVLEGARDGQGRVACPRLHASSPRSRLPFALQHAATLTAPDSSSKAGPRSHFRFSALAGRLLGQRAACTSPASLRGTRLPACRVPCAELPLSARLLLGTRTPQAEVPLSLRGRTGTQQRHETSARSTAAPHSTASTCSGRGGRAASFCSTQHAAASRRSGGRVTRAVASTIARSELPAARLRGAMWHLDAQANHRPARAKPPDGCRPRSLKRGPQPQPPSSTPTVSGSAPREGASRGLMTRGAGWAPPRAAPRRHSGTAAVYAA